MPSLPAELRLSRTAAWSAGAFATYVAVAVAYVGRFAVAHPAGGTIGNGPDVQIYLWGLRWWPYALAHGLNPFVAHNLWAPYGIDVLWTTTVPALSLLAAPVTLTLGAAVAWNVLCVLAPATSGWAAYLLCRELTGRQAPSFAGGAVFGFSSYELAQAQAHLHLTASALVALSAVMVVRYMRARLSAGGLAARLAAFSVVQFFISPEVLATMLVMGAIAMAGAFALLPERRGHWRGALLWSGAGLVAACLLLAVPVGLMLSDTGAHPLNPATYYSADLANLVIPTSLTAVGGRWAATVAAHLAGNPAEQDAYLGLPLLLLIAGFCLWQRRRPSTRLLALMFTAALLLSLGPRLHVAGHPLVALPGAALAHVPVLDAAMPGRFALYVTLAAAVIVAMALSADGGLPWRALSWSCAAAALVSLAPATRPSLWWRPTPAAIVHNDFARLIPPGSTVISLPFWSWSDHGLYAQAGTGMSFRLVDRWLQVVPKPYIHFANSAVLYGRQVTPVEVATVKRSFCAAGIDYALVWDDAWHHPHFLAALHLPGRRAHQATVYRLPCPHRAPGELLARASARAAQPPP